MSGEANDPSFMIYPQMLFRFYFGASSVARLLIPRITDSSSSSGMQLYLSGLLPRSDGTLSLPKRLGLIEEMMLEAALCTPKSCKFVLSTQEQMKRRATDRIRALTLIIRIGDISTRMSEFGSVLDGLLRDLGQGLNVKYTLGSMILLLVYDSIILVSEEMSCIWKRHWSFGKLLYVITRYGCFVDAVALLWYGFSTSHSQEANMPHRIRHRELGDVCGQSRVLIARTYAIWDQNVLVLVYLFVLQIVATIAGAFILNESNKSVVFLPSTPIVPCAGMFTDNKIFILYCFMSVVESNVVVLSLVKGAKHWRRESSVLVHTLYLDSVLCFSVLFSIAILNVILIVTLPKSPYCNLMIVPQRVFHSVLASRVILNVRSASFRGEL
ncbi:hypothetical protein SCHPADRAFT_1001333, partial [Schizopora paradoxa]